MIDEKLSLYFQQINLVKKKLYNVHSNKKKRSNNETIKITNRKKYPRLQLVIKSRLGTIRLCIQS